MDDGPPGAAWAALTALLLAVVMCWPILVTGDVFVFSDTSSYLAVGDYIFDTLGRLLSPAQGPAPGAGAAGVAGIPADEGPHFLRSLAYSTFATGAIRVGGPLFLAFAQAWVAIFTLLAVLPRNALRRNGIWLMPLLGVTTLPWFAVFVMPDIFTAVVILFGAVLWRNFDQLTTSHRVILVLLASFATFAHYGNPPLALGLYGCVLLGRLLQRRLTFGVMVAALVPVLIAPLGNLGVSTAVLDDPSTSPKRLPILLARSIEDGPAAWYLSDACGTDSGLAICEAFDGDVPDNTAKFLWSDEGIESLTDAQMDALRAEETEILKRAFLAYPLAQSWSLLRNAVRQLHLVGLNKIVPVPSLKSGTGAGQGGLAEHLLEFFDPVVAWTTLAGAVGAAVLALPDPRRRPVLLIVCGGLVLNALIFGGLSAPDHRYQARVIWLLPALALAYLSCDWARWRNASRPRDRASADPTPE